MRRRNYVTLKNLDRLQVAIIDRELNEKLNAYAKAANTNIQNLVHTLCTTQKTIDDLIDELNKDKYRMMDEEQKIDLLVKYEKALNEISANKEES